MLGQVAVRQPPGNVPEHEISQRIRQAVAARGRSLTWLATALGVSKQSLNSMLESKWARGSRLPDLAKALEVDVEWLTTGTNPPVFAAHFRRAETLGQGVSIYGVVAKASNAEEDITGAPISVVDEPRIVTLPGSWVLVQIDGMSAYPVVYPQQFGIFDQDRSARPPFSHDELHDLHDNIVLVQLMNGRALLKRFCHAERHPDGFHLATIDAGRSSPYVPVDEIAVVMPMVGTLYQDPSKPRVKMWHGSTVTPRGVGP